MKFIFWRTDSPSIVHSTNAPDTPDTLRITDTSHRFNNLHTFFTNITDRARSMHSTDASDTLHTTHSIYILRTHFLLIV